MSFTGSCFLTLYQILTSRCYIQNLCITYKALTMLMLPHCAQPITDTRLDSSRKWFNLVSKSTKVGTACLILIFTTVPAFF